MTCDAAAETIGLHVVDLSKRIRGKTIVDSVSLSLYPGEIVGMLGRNGAGKTSCFYAIAGLLTPKSGSVHLDGQDVTRFPLYVRARLGLGYLPQEDSVFRGLTVEENIVSVLELCMHDPVARKQAVEDLLAEFSIQHIRNTKASALSGGERRRVEIARCIASEPKYIMFDEPFAGIDPIAARDIRALVRYLKRRGVGVLISDHNWRETLNLVDRVFVLSEGSVLVEGTPDDVVRDERFVSGYLGHDDDDE
ncbi:MAG: LPS export ABC transporter ATP-binding protein [Rhodobacteraceae bacterium]|nr:LPS export ABC transporter ATP-binding protein [Paracoccaceae bacterium]